MEYVQLAFSDLKISRIGFGCAAISGFDYGKVNERESIEAIRKAWEGGVNLFDTADVYGFGYAEKVLAKALGNERHNAIITTKFGVDWDLSKKTHKDCSVKRMNTALEGSLRRMNLDCIPIYLVHWYDGKTPIHDLMGALHDCKKQGKIRYVGCSNFSEEMINEVLKTYKLDLIQLPYNLLRREYENQLYINSTKQQILTTIYDVLARGLLTGKYNKKIKFGKNDTRAREGYFTGVRLDYGLNMVKRLKTIARKYNKTTGQVAIRWALDKSFINCVLVGNKNRLQVSDNIDVFSWSLTQEDHQELET